MMAVAKKRLSVVSESVFKRSAANQPTSAPAAPAMSAVRQSMRPFTWFFAVVKIAVKTMAAIDVATAVFCPIFKSTTNAGTITTPPPTPHSAAITPPIAPMSRVIIMGFMPLLLPLGRRWRKRKVHCLHAAHPATMRESVSDWKMCRS